GAERKTRYRNQIWFQPFPKGEITRITNDLDDYSSLSIAGDGKTLYASSQRLASTIYVGETPSVLNEGADWKFHALSAGATPGWILSWTGSGRLLQTDYSYHSYVTAPNGDEQARILEEDDFVSAPMGCGPADTIVMARLGEGSNLYNLWRLNL